MKENSKILEELRRGKSLDQLAEALGMRKETVQAMLESLARQGVIAEVDCDTNCGNCPMSKSCPSPSAGREKLYVLKDRTYRK